MPHQSGSILTQEGKDAIKCAKEYSAMCGDILKKLKMTAPEEHDKSIGAQLFRAVDPCTGEGHLNFSCGF